MQFILCLTSENEKCADISGGQFAFLKTIKLHRKKLFCAREWSFLLMLLWRQDNCRHQHPGSHHDHVSEPLDDVPWTAWKVDLNKTSLICTSKLTTFLRLKKLLSQHVIGSSYANVIYQLRSSIISLMRAWPEEGIGQNRKRQCKHEEKGDLRCEFARVKSDSRQRQLTRLYCCSNYLVTLQVPVHHLAVSLFQPREGQFRRYNQ